MSQTLSNNLQLLDLETFNLRDLLSPVDNFTVTDGDTPLTSLVTNAGSSFEPILVYEKNMFIGVLSLGDNLFKNRLPYTTKAKRAAFTPPKLTENHKLFDIVHAMLSTRLHALPIFNNGDVIGIIESARIMQWINTVPQNLSLLSNAVEISKPITLPNSASAQDALTLFRSTENSHIIIITHTDNSIAGVVTRNDLRSVFMSPPTRDRFTAGNAPRSRAVKDTEEKYRGDTPIHTLYRPSNFEVPESWDMRKIISTLIDSDYNTVIILNNERFPKGIISNQDLLVGISKLQPIGDNLR